jgi:hypothetical protein
VDGATFSCIKLYEKFYELFYSSIFLNPDDTNAPVGNPDVSSDSTTEGETNPERCH